MNNKLSDFEKMSRIKNLIGFLEKNKNVVKSYQKLEQFEEKLNDLYFNLKEVFYDSIEFDVPETVEIYENDNYFYYSESITKKEQKISIVNKSLNEFFFVSILNTTNLVFTKYYKDKDNKIKIVKQSKSFDNIEQTNEYKTLILKNTISN